ncbi:MAG TPA: flagellar hook-basal body complex protein, partial [Magnetovibrio sp.]
ATAKPGDVHTVSAQATDSLGNTQTVQLHFTAQTNGAFKLSIPGAQQGDIAGPAYDGVTVQFDANGAITSAPPAIAIASPSGGAADLSVNLDLGGVTRLGDAFSLNTVHSDGARYGNVTGVSVNAQGVLSATFSNGETRAVAEIPVATFASPQGLEAIGGNVYQATDASGAPVYGAAGAGQIQGGALELSTTDLATEFVNLIVAQSSYSASLKVLSAGDEMSRALLDVRA